MSYISKYDDIIDSELLEAHISRYGSDMDADELAELLEFAQQFKDAAESYEHGEIAIHDSHFEEYCRDLLADLGYLPNDLPGFIEHNIDWSGVAETMQQDYTMLDFGSETYWTR